MNGDEGLVPPGGERLVGRRSASAWWDETATSLSETVTPSVEKRTSAWVQDELRAGAQIVGLERRRKRARSIWRSGFALGALIVLIAGAGTLVVVLTDRDTLDIVPLVALLAVAWRFIDDDAGVECTPAELGELVGYVTGRENGKWTVTSRGEAARAAYLALDPKESR